MLKAEDVKPYLSHPDEEVRALAADYFGDSWSRDPEILPLILDARERFGDEPFFRNLSRAKRFLITGPALDRLIGLLDGTDSERLIDQLGPLIAKAPVELLRERWDALGKHPKLDPEVIRGIERRLEYLGWTGETLWDALKDFARQQDEAHREVRTQEGEDISEELIDALGTRDVPDGETICRLLGDSEVKDSWLEVHLATLAGRRRLREAIPRLVEKYHEEGADFLIEETTEALSRIGDAAEVGPLVENYNEGDWSFRLCAALTLGHLKHPESEAAVLKLLEREDDDELRTFLCASLCELISEHAVEAVRAEIASGSQMAFRETVPHALAVATMLGQELPKGAVQWEREKKRQREAIKKAEGAWATEVAISKGMTDPDLVLNGGDGPVPEAEVEVTRPIRHEGPRAGRNDPCPCGSGKKYKKCCGASR